MSTHLIEAVTLATAISTLEQGEILEDEPTAMWMDPILKPTSLDIQYVVP
jgi:hypothetical protein